MSAIYRKYRPQTFGQMIGQNHIKITLQHELERNEVGHAYLFCGPRGLGKTTSARLFAKSVNCENRKEGESEPCNECRSCLDITAGRSVNVIEIDAASNTGVDNVRENIIENSRFSPAGDKYKIFIIDEAHMLSTSAFNALLKIMEEPPAHVIFILCTTEIHKLPLTVISRCQRFDFKKVSAKELVMLLERVIKEEGKQVDREVIERIVAYSEGCVRDAQSLLGKILSLGDNVTLDQAEIILPRSDFDSVYRFVSYLAEKNNVAAIELVNKLIEEGVDPAIFAESLLEFLRQLLLLKVDGRLEIFGVGLSEDLSKQALELSGKFNYGELIDMIDVFLDKPKEIKQSPIPQFPLEIAVVRIIEKVACSKPDSIVFNQSVGGVNPGIKSSNSNLQIKSSVPPAVASKEEQAVPPTEIVKEESEVIASESNEETTNNGVESVSPSGDGMASLSLDEVVGRWEEIIQKLMEENFSMASLLRISQPVRCEGSALEIAVSSKFYKDRLEANNHRQVIENVLAQIMNCKVLIKGIVSQSVNPIAVNIEFGEEKNEESSESSEQKNGLSVTPIKVDVAEEVMSMF